MDWGKQLSKEKWIGESINSTEPTNQQSQFKFLCSGNRIVIFLLAPEALLAQRHFMEGRAIIYKLSRFGHLSTKQVYDGKDV